MKHGIVILAVVMYLINGNLLANAQDSLLAQCAEQLSGEYALTGHFRQEKVLEFLEKPVISNGDFIITANGRMTWHVIEPVESRMEVRGNTVTLDGERVRGQGMVRMMTMLMNGFMRGDFHDIERQFDVTGEVGDDGWALTLHARTTRIKSAIESINLAGEQHLHFIDIIENGGNRTRIEFSGVHPFNTDEQ